MKPILAEAYTFFMTTYLDPKMYTVEECYQRLVEKAKKEGWEIPTLDEMKEWLARTIEVTSDRI
ncbi:hypothetical protein GVX81_00690 [[Haemophilus] felis]|uniref:Mu DNA binding I gamma subdomain domain-containing protein n=1 Tax=[Haemophilus] felis TaxID=123822 RepID=A0A1T0B7B3_9PAST|nr:hypothetical protein [[Haemophilus] felis]OOS05872.1 hypothetical protein B0188_03600 [[Haemophilus] felis]